MYRERLKNRFRLCFVSQSEMATPEACADVQENVKIVLERIQRVVETAQIARRPRLVAVSKLKDAAHVQAAYDVGQRVFGENYVQELVDKAAQLPRDIQWHFIGHLQSNKAKSLVCEVPNLACVETVDSDRLAAKLNEAAEAANRESPLNVMLQVNTSGEDTKSGVNPGDEVALGKFVQEKCPHLRCVGLMTIGMPDYTSTPANFRCLAECRVRLAEALGVAEDTLELSMGMSADFEQAIEMGSTNVRVGSTIFGARQKRAGH
eukprot:TRINITY_DN4913_c0_g1_i1.p1 TRINITY_DN4913_c0_g1~~TRINITY_DN4913_c0_g1_i1.p1  ORF type:complete len:263 (+),score=48.73 TRINITY_DN4913_c0_g1_i1:121-909(+)